MNREKNHVYQFNSFRLEVEERQLLNNGVPVPLMPKMFYVLALLVERSGHLVAKDELLDKVWADTFVEEANVTRIIHELRKVLGEDKNGNKFIETVAKKGYRFVAKVTEECEPQQQQADEREKPSSVDEAFPDTIEVDEPSESAVLVRAADPAVDQKSRRRIVFFTVGFATALSLILLLSFSFWPRSGAEPAMVRSIAVLPLRPINAANRDEIYEIGIADSLIHRLVSIKGFIIRPLSAVRKYTELDQDPLAAGREQKVDYILASNYQLADGKIRITAQLLNVANGQIEETYKTEKDAANLFSMQDAIAGEVGTLLQVRFAAPESNRLVKRGTDNEEAYRLYLQGSALADKRHQRDVRKAIGYFEEAVRLDPNYAPAYARLANAQTAMVSNGGEENLEQYPKAKAAIEKALSIDPTLAEAHSYLGEIRSDFEWDFAQAELEHRKAIELDPNSPVAHRMYALMLNCLGRHNEAIAEIKTAIDLEPASVLNHLMFGRILLFARRYNESIIELERTAEMEPDRFFAYQSLSLAYRYNGDGDRGFESLMKAWILAGNEPEKINSWRSTYAKSGWQGVFERQLEEEKTKEKNGKPNYNRLTNLLSDLGRRDEALAYLEKEIAQRNLMSLLKVHPRFDSLRGDPRFDEILKRVGF